MTVRDDIKRYYAKKTTCPKCKSKDIAETAINIIEGYAEGKYKDTKNYTMCLQCQWRGPVDELKG